MKKLLLLALTLNLCLIVEGRAQTNVLEMAKPAAPGRIPWTETFATTTLDPVKWPVNRGAEANAEGLAEPSAPYALNLDGNESGVDEIQTQAFDLAGMNNVKFEYAYQRGGSGNAPEAGDDLWVDYLNAAGQWVNLKQYPGASAAMTTFTKETIFLPTAAHHAAFQLRFRNKATPGPNDDWFIDDLQLSPSPDIGITPSRLSATVAWPGSASRTLTIRNDGHSELNFKITSRDKSGQSFSPTAQRSAEPSFPLIASEQIEDSQTAARNDILDANYDGLADDPQPSAAEIFAPIFASNAVSNLKIGLIQTGDSFNTVHNRLASLGYRNISIIPPASNLAQLKNYDVIYLPSNWAQLEGGSYSTLQSRSADYLAYVKDGGGLFIDQPNPYRQSGQQVTPSLLPYPITFYSPYDTRDFPPVIVNANHEITKGLRHEEMPGPHDLITALAPEYEVLVRGAVTASPSLVVATHGRGRILVQTTHPNGFSAAVYIRMVEWVGKKAAADMAWLSYTPNAGTIAPGDSLKITVQFNSKHVILGFTYNADLVISSNDPDEAVVTVAAQMTVNPESYFVAVNPAASTAEGYGKDVVTHTLRLRNYGQNSDSYNLTPSGNRWKTKFFDSTGVKLITRTPTVAAGGNLKILVKVTIDSLAAKGAQDTARVTVVSVGNPGRSSSAKLTTTSRGLRLRITKLPFTDHFPSLILDSLKWFNNLGPAVVNARGANEPSPPNSLNLNGTDIVRSQAIDLSGKSGVLLRYAYEMGGEGDPAEWNNDLWLDYLDNAGKWINLKRHAGGGARMTSYVVETITLPAGAYHRNFAIRFRTTGKADSDDWFVDDVNIYPPPDIVVAPANFGVTLNWGDTTTQTVRIGNTGQSELNYSIAIKASTSNSMSASKIDETKQAEYLSKIQWRDFSRDATSTTPIANPNYRDGVAPAAQLNETFEAAGLANPTAVPAKIYWDYSHSRDHYAFSSVLKELSKAGHTIQEMSAPMTATALLGFDILVIEVPKRALLNDEIAAAQAFVKSGHGLFVIGEAEGYIGASATTAVNSLLKPYGMSLSNSFDPFDTAVRNFTAHPVTINLRATEFIYFSAIAANAPSLKLARTDAGIAVLAAAEAAAGKIVLISDSNPFENTRLYKSDNLVLGLNIIDWLSSGAGLNWLTAAPASGKVAPDDSAKVNLRFNAKSVIPGRTYRANVIVASNDPDESPFIAPVQMAVNPDPYFVAVDPAASTAEGYGKDAVTHALRLHNYGSNNDSYTLRLAGNNWRTQFFDSTGTKPLTVTPNVAAGASLKILVKVTVDSLAAKGKKDTVRVAAASVGNPARVSSAKLTTTSRGPRLRTTKLPFTDYFPGPTLDSLKWFNNFGPAVVNARGANEPSPPNSLNLNGTDNVRSQAIDLSGKAGVLVRYAYEMGGDGDPADWGNDLWLDYLDGEGNWINLQRHLGSRGKMSFYAAEEMILPPGAYHRNFAIRFRTTGKANNDDWFIDDIRITPPPEIAISHVPAPFEFRLNLGDSATAAITLLNEGQGDLDFQISDVDSVSTSTNQLQPHQLHDLEETAPNSAPDNKIAAGIDPSGNATAAPDPHQSLQPQKAHVAGGRVLWDLTHGVLELYEPAGQYNRLNALLTKSRYTIETTTKGVDKINLFSYDVLVVCLGSAWSTVYSSSEVAAIRRFVESGGGLLIMGDHPGTNNKNINPVAKTFGITCGRSQIPDVSNFANHPIFKEVRAIRYAGGGEVEAVTPAIEVASTGGGLGAVAVATPGRGRVAVTGDINFCSNGYIAYDNNQLFAENLFSWLAEKSASADWLTLTPTSGTVAPAANVKIMAKVNAGNLLLPGRTYRKNIFISSNDADEKIVRIPATLHVNPEPYFVRVDPAASQGQGYGKDAVTHALRIFNLGQNNDAYNLTPGGNKWKTRFYDSTGVAPISTTPTVAAGGNLKILVKVTIDSLAAKGTLDTVRVTVASVGNPARSILAKLTTVSRGIRIRITKLPFTENFSAAKLDSLKWLDNLGPAVVNERGANEPSGPTSLNLNFNDDVRSQSLDLSGKSGVQIRYAYQMGGEGNAPDVGNDLWLDYFNSAGKWVNLKRHLGNGSRMNFYNTATLTLPDGAYHKNFSIRFRATGKPNVDDWFVDDLAIALPPVIAVTPALLEATLNKGDSTTQTLTITNRGESALNYSITIREHGESAAETVAPTPQGNLGPLSQSQRGESAAMIAPQAAAVGRAAPLRILAWTGYADLAREYPNTLAALRQFYTDFTLTATSTQAPSELQTLLNAAEVFLIPEQETSVNLTSLGASWAAILNRFVTGGGTVIVLEHGPSSARGSTTLLNGTGLMKITIQGYFGASSVRVVDAAHPITAGLPGTFLAMNGNNTHVADGVKIIENVSSSGAVVSARTIGRGHVVYIGMDFFDYNSEMARLLANAVQWQGVRVEWLALLSPGVNTIAPGATQNVSLQFNAKKLPADTTVAADVVVSSNAPANPVVTIPVTLRIAPAAGLTKLAAQTLPENFALNEAYPNPFSMRGIFNNPGTTLEYELPRDSRVSIQIFDSMGRTVRTLIDGPKPAGYHRAVWNGRNQLGNTVAAGVYLLRMTARATNGEMMFGKTRRMTLVK